MQLTGQLGGAGRAVAWVALVVLALLAVGVGALALGTFATLVQTSPLALRSVGTLAQGLAGELGLGAVPGLWLAVGLAVLASLLAALAAYIKPRN